MPFDGLFSISGQFLQDPVGSPGEEPLGQFAPVCLAVCAGPAVRIPVYGSAVHIRNQPFEIQPVAMICRARPSAPGSCLPDDAEKPARPIRPGASARGSARPVFRRWPVLLSDFDAQGPLASRRQHERFVEVFGDAMRQSEPPDPGGRQNDRVEFFVGATSFLKRVSRLPRNGTISMSGRWTAQLCRPTQAAGADPGGKGQSRKRRVFSGDQDVGGIFTLGNRPDTKPLRHVGRHVFHAVDRQIDSSLQQSLFDLFDEQSLAADFGQRNVENFIAFGLDGDELNRKGREVFQQFRLNPIGLPQGQRALSGPDAKTLFMISGRSSNSWTPNTRRRRTRPTWKPSGRRPPC